MAQPGWTRRGVATLLGGGALAAAAGVARGQPAAAPAMVRLPFANGERPLVALPGKRALIVQTTRPPQLETPLSVFDASGAITPNDAFFVRYHLSDIPTLIDPASFRLHVGGHVARPLALSLAALRRDFPAREIVAVNQCSGNSRGFWEPRVGGGQHGHGSMGCARWTGVALRDVLERAGVKDGALDVTFDGLDAPPAPSVPDFVKALAVDHAMGGEVMIAWGMNGADLPWLNGFPLRLVVPGWFGTYWVKHLARIEVRAQPFDGYWMAGTYRVPDTDCACVPQGTRPERTRPISRFVVRALITSHVPGDRVAPGPVEVRGLAFDAGSGIARVDVSADAGQTWTPAMLGEDLGGFAFRRWAITLPLKAGDHVLMARATARSGETQPFELRWNPSGYMRNVVERVPVVA
jgi:DMSO/TMAO reductase YedYZ molybdopterin-dependent catalytic subunit